MSDLSRLCIHTITTKPWDVETAAKHFFGRRCKRYYGVARCIARKKYQDTGRMLRDYDLSIVSLCRGGFFHIQMRQKNGGH